MLKLFKKSEAEIRELFFQAASKGDFKTLKKWIKKVKKMQHRQTGVLEQALYHSIKHNKVKVIEYLIENGSSLHFKTKAGGDSPLLVAVKIGAGNKEKLFQLVKYLTENGAELDVKDQYGHTALFIAFQNGHHTIAKYLLEKSTIAQRQAFFKAASEAAIKNKIEFPLHCTIGYGTLDKLKALIANGAQIEKKDKNGYTPLQYAVKFGKLKIVKVLVDVDAKFNTKDILSAHENGHHDIVEYLTEKQSEKTLKETVSNKDLCIICLSPRNGFYILYPCHHASLCESCCEKMKGRQCPTCRKTIKSFNKIYFQSA